MTPSRQSSHRKAKSVANDKISGIFLKEGLNDDEWSYNTNPCAYKNNGHESEGRRVLFSSSDNSMEVTSPLGDAVKPTLTCATPTSADSVVSSRAEQGKENKSQVGSIDDETVMSAGEELRLNLDVESDSPVDLAGVHASQLKPPTVKPTFATLKSPNRIVSSRLEQGKENHSPPVGNIGDETVVSLGQEPKVNSEGKRNIAVGLVKVRAGLLAGLLTPPDESHKSWKRQKDQVVRQLPEEFGKRDILRIKRRRQMEEVVRQLPEEFGKREILRSERRRQMEEVVRQVPRDFVKRDILRSERAFRRGEMARVLEQIDVEYFGPDWDDF
jgi:hypothetical protein